MRLSNMADYAVVIMSAASRHCGSARVSATDLAAETRVGTFWILATHVIP